MQLEILKKINLFKLTITKSLLPCQYIRDVKNKRGYKYFYGKWKENVFKENSVNFEGWKILIDELFCFNFDEIASNIFSSFPPSPSFARESGNDAVVKLACHHWRKLFHATEKGERSFESAARNAVNGNQRLLIVQW